MIVDQIPPLVPPMTAASAEQAASDSAATPQLNAEKIKTSGKGVDLIGDATSWPSLSESTRPSPRSSPAPPSDPPVAAAQAPAVSHSPQNHGHPNNNTTSNSNHSRQKSSGRGGTNRGGASRGGFIRHPPPPQQFPSPPPPPPAFYGGFEGPMRGPFFYGNGFGSRPRPMDNHFSYPSSSHGGGAHPRGDGGRHHKHANYRGSDWNADTQGFHTVDVRFPQPGPPMGFPLPQQPVMPFTFMRAPIFPPEPFMGMPPYTGGHAPIPPSSLSPPPFVDLHSKLLNQINYYFSDENLIKDMYLRTKMDDCGWVPITLIAGFKKVRDLTQDIQLILEALGASSMVEVQGDKIRRRNDWRRWIPATSVSKEPTTELNSMIRYLQKATLEESHAADRSSSSATTASSSRREVLT